jgi:hypothetical protein
MEIILKSRWIKIEDETPQIDKPLWYFFDMVGTHKGVFRGFYEGNEGMHVFVGHHGGWLTGDVTHWQYDEGQGKPDEPVYSK